GERPGALYVGPDGQILVSTDAAKGNPAKLERVDLTAGRLVRVEIPDVKHGIFRAAGNDRWILLFDPGQRPPDALQAFDVASSRWAEIQNPGVSGWEPLAAR
ncbi:MAG TPA: hypothetical protein VMS88_01410, partial [Terriglobales bacterium]|nr:hypothetical protein [Terriglobales bacterium]